MTTVRRWLVTYLVLLPAVTVAGAVLVGAWAGYPVTTTLFVLSFLGGGAVFTGFSGAIQATEKFEAAGVTGVYDLDRDLLASDAEMDYDDRAGLAVWGLGTFVAAWIGLIAASIVG